MIVAKLLPWLYDGVAEHTNDYPSACTEAAYDVCKHQDAAQSALKMSEHCTKAG